MFRCVALALVVGRCFLCSAASTIPGVSNAASPAGVPWTTEVHILNLGNSTANITIAFVGIDGGQPVPSTQAILPGQPAVWADILNALWNLAGASGTLRVTADQPLAITASKYTPANSGRFGTSLPVLSDADLIGPGVIGDALWVSQSVDPTAGFSTTLSLYLALPGSSANIVLFDAAGNQVATMSVSGSGQAMRIPIAALATGDLPVGRAEVQVQSGYVAGSCELTDNITGDLMAAPLQSSANQLADVTLTGALHQAAPTGGYVQTDVRILNTDAINPALININSATGSAQLTLQPHAMQEISDVLGTLLNVPGDSPSLVHITVGNGGAPQVKQGNPAPQFIVAASRTAVVTNYGAPGIFGEIHPAASTFSLLQDNATSAITGLTAANPAFLVSYSDSAGGSGQIALKDPTGAVLFNVPSLTLAAGGLRMDPLGSFFSGATFPSDSRIELTQVSGYLDGALLSFDAATGDPTFSAAQILQPHTCAPPGARLTAPVLTLSSPGTATLNWSTSLADIVRLDPGVTITAGTGSATVEVDDATVFTLTASNACGSTSTQITIAVGNPEPSSAIISSGPAGGSGNASGSPGQLMSVLFADLAEPANVTRLLFTAADGSVEPVNVLGVASDGSLQALVPLWIDSTQPHGYRTGNFQVSAVFTPADPTGATPTGGPITTDAVPFIITELSYSGDPVADFTSLLDSTSAAFQAAFSAAGTVTGLSQAVTDQQTMASAIEASLRKMVLGVAASGASTITYGMPGASGATTVSVTTGDLAAMLAYNANLLTAAGAGSLTPGSSGCLATQRPMVGICKALETQKRINGQLADAFANMTMRFDTDPLLEMTAAQVTNSYVSGLLKTTRLGGIGSILRLWWVAAQALCIVHPVRLDQFTVTPQPFATITLDTTGSLATQLAVTANLVADLQENSLPDYAEQSEGPTTVAWLTAKGIGADVASAFFQAVVSVENPGVVNVLGNIVDDLPFLQTSDQVQVGSCDLNDFYAATNGSASANGGVEPYYPGLSLLQRDEGKPQGQPNYYYIGRQPGQEGLCISANWDSFLFSEAVEQTLGQYSAGCGDSPASAPSGRTVRPRYSTDIPIVKFLQRVGAAIGASVAPVVVLQSWKTDVRVLTNEYVESDNTAQLVGSENFAKVVGFDAASAIIGVYHTFGSPYAAMSIQSHAVLTGSSQINSNGEDAEGVMTLQVTNGSDRNGPYPLLIGVTRNQRSKNCVFAPYLLTLYDVNGKATNYGNLLTPEIAATSDIPQLNASGIVSVQLTMSAQAIADASRLDSYCFAFGYIGFVK